MANKVIKIPKAVIDKQSKILFVQIAALINKSKENVLHSVNKELTLLNWHIGKQLHETFTNIDERYGLEIVATLSQLLNLLELKQFQFFKKQLIKNKL